LANTGFQTVFYHIGLEPKHTVRRYASVIWNLGKWNSMKWNETRRIGAIFACFCVARVCQHQLGFLVWKHWVCRKCVSRQEILQSF